MSPDFEVPHDPDPNPWRESGYLRTVDPSQNPNSMGERTRFSAAGFEVPGLPCWTWGGSFRR